MSSLPDKTARSALDPLWRGLRAVRAAITVGFYMVIAPSGYVPFALFCLLWRGDQRGRARILHRVSARGVRIMHWWLRTFRIIHFDWRRVDLGLPAGPCVVVANHPTQLDPTAMMAVLVNGCTIVKPSVYRRRLVRPLLEGAMHFEGPSLDPMSIDHVLHSAVDRLRSGMHLFVFPEGTRSPEGKLNEFGRIAFEVACRAQVPIVSVALRCEPCYLSRETPLFRPPAQFPRLFMERLAIDDPASCGGDSRVLRERIEGRYRQWVADGMPPIVAVSAPVAGGFTQRNDPLLEAALEVSIEMGPAQRIDRADRLAVRRPSETDATRNRALAYADDIVSMACEIANRVQLRQLPEEEGRLRFSRLFTGLDSGLLQRVLSYAFFVMK